MLRSLRASYILPEAGEKATANTVDTYINDLRDNLWGREVHMRLNAIEQAFDSQELTIEEAIGQLYVVDVIKAVEVYIATRHL